MDPGDFENLAKDVLEPRLEEIPDKKKPRGKGKNKQQPEVKEDFANPLQFDFNPAIPVPEQPKPEPTDTISPEELLKKKQKKVDRIFAYREKFKFLKQRNKITGKSGDEEVDDELHYIENQLGNQQGNTGGINMLFITAMYGLEMGANQVYNPLDLKLTGLGDTCKASITQFEPLLDELAIKYGAGFTMSVELRLAVMIGTTVLTVHSANSGNPHVTEALNRMGQMHPDASKYKDL